MTNMMPAGDSMGTASDLSEDYLRIGDLARQFGLTLRTLRFYEDKGLITPKREGNTRLYSRRDVARLKLILLGRKVGFSLREVKQMMDLYDPEGSNMKQLRMVIEKSERQLVKLEKQRLAVDEAIGELKGAIGKWRHTLAARRQSSSA